MPEKQTLRRAQRDKATGKSPTTQAGEFVREEVHHVREGKHGARSPKQAIAIGLSKARRAGVKLPPPKRGQTSETTRRGAERAHQRGQGAPAKRRRAPSRAAVSMRALQREGRSSATSGSLSRQTAAVAARRSSADRSASAKKAVATKGGPGRRAAAKKAARTRAARSSS